MSQKRKIDDESASSSKRVRSGTTSESSPSTTPPLNLEALLDLTSLATDEDIGPRFAAISKALLHDYLLVVTREDGSTTRIQVLEHEFYFQNAGIHEDPFAHGSEEQKVGGRWYFHRAPRRSEDSNRSATSLTAYRGGSRKGMDLTFGRPTAPTSSDPYLRGGILLRSIRVLGPSPKVISGPSLLVDQILSLSGASEIPELVETKWNNNLAALPPPVPDPIPRASLRVVSKASLGVGSSDSDSGGPAPAKGKLNFAPAAKTCDSSASGPPTIFKSPRIGLDLSHPGTTSPTTKPLHSRIQFLPRQYRYFTHPDELVANGRIQTFVGLIHHFTSSSASTSTSSSAPAKYGGDLDNALGKGSSKLLGDICRTMGLKDKTAKKYLVDFKEGREGGLDVLEGFVGPKGKGASSSPAAYLVMMGALSTL